MTEVSPADLRSIAWHYQSSRALSDVLIGDDLAPPLLGASSTGDITALQKILAESPEIALASPHRIYKEERPAHAKDDVRQVYAMKQSNVYQAVLRAAANGHVEAVSVLLAFALQQGLQTSSVIGRETVKTTVQNGHAAVFDVLATADSNVAAHQDIHPIDRPLDLALAASNIELVKVILQHGGGRPFSAPGRSEYSYAPRGGSRLGEAAKKSKAMTVLLIQDGYPVQGSGALQSAAQYGKLDIVRLLVEEHGADVNERLPAETLPRRDKELYASWTPMHFAASRAQTEVMELLESYGSRSDVLDVNGKTPLQLMQEYRFGKRDRDIPV